MPQAMPKRKSCLKAHIAYGNEAVEMSDIIVELGNMSMRIFL
jgi:hypothetical protein